MDPFAMLKADHKKVAALFEKLDDTTERAVKGRRELFEDLHRELIAHMLVEEAAFYPSAKEAKGTRSLAFEAVEEHKVVKILLGALASMPVDSEEWTAKLSVLKETVEHHVEEEEEELFPESRKLLSGEEQAAIAARLENEKARVLAVLEGDPSVVLPTTADPGELGLR